ncbi:MAG: cytochrome c oxidase subunit 3 [Rickettsiales bacterium]|nr:cytochrome c oxidase subunit 3 [Pseudomonadota bacterium]MDA0965581.1 cytochrome c oxidase subunit 3 [Pseudomonadota bacterium]MDG4542905.1 cytochrome c oxidase subunit 3 [Rickettsiales bacterium]MDG4544647.1 cytochrome c oxidase subunit 3 [Rickettsiales bacterium]MDG4546769.1 cytochrome c oxidase subunit 3 [Rickettsiales bacterium]
MSGEQKHDYHLVDPSPWPLIGAFSGLLLATGALFFMHGKPAGNIMLIAGFAAVIFTMFVWWKDVIKEGKGGHHKNLVQHGLRVGMALFILSEVMFFFAFFWAFFKAALAPELVFDGAHIFEEGIKVVEGVWPPVGIETFNAWDLPFINTLVLLLSGTTVTWAHYALLRNDRKNLIRALLITVLLGISFTCLQAYEYHHAAFGFKDGIYSSNFYMATGFHGAHVLIGTIFLAICLIRALKGDMSPKHHLGFEFAAWYWHFVDVVWLFLFAFVYVWGS